jgi:hypothetical protein
LNVSALTKYHRGIPGTQPVPALIDQAKAPATPHAELRSMTAALSRAGLSWKALRRERRRQCDLHCCEWNDGQACEPNAIGIDIPATDTVDSWTVD